MAANRPLDALPEGTRLAGYVIGRVLGRGGFGVTYAASDVLWSCCRVHGPASQSRL